MTKLIEEKWVANISTRSLIKVLYFLLITSCAYNDIPRSVDCTTSTLEITSIEKVDESSCLIKDGMAEVFVIGGVGSYLYSINGQDAQQSNLFSKLSAGAYTLTVQDAKGCLDTISFKISNFESTLTARAFTTKDDLCLGGNGSVKVRPLNGLPPFQFTIANQVPSVDSIFLNLNHGQYNMTVMDALQCEYRFSVAVPQGKTGVSWANTIKPVLAASCNKAGCHVAGTGRVDLTKFENVKLYAGQIRARVISRSMPFDGNLPEDHIQLIACWVEDGALEN
jgi:hypothetical protein